MKCKGHVVYFKMLLVDPGDELSPPEERNNFQIIIQTFCKNCFSKEICFSAIFCILSVFLSVHASVSLHEGCGGGSSSKPPPE